MKNILLIGAALLAGIKMSNAQVDTRSKVDVVGTAEREVTPDIIYLNISLKEYLENNNSKKRVNITTLENQLMKAAELAHIDKKDITINSISGYTNYWQKKKNPEFLDNKSYKIKLKDLNSYNILISGLDPKGLENSYISGYEYSKMDDLKKELKVIAAKNAKEKAQILTEAIGNKLGKVINLSDVDYNNDNNYPQVMYKAMAMRTSVADEAEAAPEIDFKSIKVKAQVNATFEIAP